MRALAVNQLITYLFCKRPRHGEIIDYDAKYCRYRVKSAYGVSWVRRKNIIETEGYEQETSYRSSYRPPTEPVSFSMTLE